MQKLVFDVCGEFGYELLAVAPLVNWYKINGYDIKVLTSTGSKYIYPGVDVQEIYNTRIPFLQLKINGKITYHQHHHIGDMWYKPLIGEKLFWEEKWTPANLKEFYKDTYKVSFDRPPIIISNKHQVEWGGPPVNTIAIETLREIFYLLKDRYTVIYNRPKSDDISNDNSSQLEFGDRELCQELGIVTVQDCMEEFNYDYNETQLALYVNSSKFISTQGGNSAFASMFGGDNIIYGVRGNEFNSNAYSTWFKLLSNQNIYTCKSSQELSNLTKIVFT